MEDSFKIRSYGFCELAQLYFPNIAKKSASIQLGRWIRMDKKLATELFQAGLKPRQRILTPLQVEIVVKIIGKP